MSRTRQRHTRCIQRVIDHIHRHSEQNIDSATLADIAALSPYHWHRIYQAVTGESAVATVRRVRLEKAAAALLRERRPVAAIAADCGFDNLQAFTRLFRRTYGLPPGQFRRNAIAPIHAGTTDSPTDTSGAVPTALSTPSPPRVEIGDHDPIRLVGRWHTGDYLAIGAIFEAVMAVAALEHWPRAEPYSVGVYFDDPDVVPVPECRAFAGIPVASDDFACPSGFDEYHVAGGTHASLPHIGPYPLLPESYRWLYRDWLRASSLDARDAPCHEIYLNTPYDTLPADLETRICLPLATAENL